MNRPRYSISVAAEMTGMHPQTLRMYDTRGLVSPRRTPGGTRRYSEADLLRLRKINQLTTELGMNLVGASRVLALEETVQQLLERVRLLEQQLAEEGVRLRREVDHVHRSYRRDLVIYHPPKHPERWTSRN